jgi:secondary thiamine-phosphate synthase enzyme
MGRRSRHRRRPSHPLHPPYLGFAPHSGECRPAARRDLERWLAKIAPESTTYEHDEEGPDDMPAHLRSALTATSLGIPLLDGRLALGTWQGIYLLEHRRRPTPREVALHLIGE